MKALLNRVLANDLCSGCGLCSVQAAEGAIRMQVNEDGYLRPSIDPAWADRELADAHTSEVFARSCPALGLDITPQRSAAYNPLWGEVKACLRGHATDPETRHAGSSGGVISALASFCLEQGLVDGVIQIRASSRDPLLNEAVISRTRDEVLTAAGSRYAPAAPITALRQALRDDQRYLFVGKPCDVAAVRQWQAQEPRLNDKLPYLLSFMCAGTPSLRGTHQVLERLGTAPEAIDAFRYRGDGWPGLTKATLKSGEERTMTYNDSWGKVLNRHLQTRCKICPDGIGEFADIVCADGWEGDERGYPSFEERPGRSLVLLRTDRGCDLFRQAESAGSVEAEGFDHRLIASIQPFQFYRRSTVLPRLMAMRLLGLKTPRYRGFDLARCARAIGLLRSVKAFTGLLSRRRKIKRRPLATTLRAQGRAGY